MSPEGACMFGDCTEVTTGKANFGFVSKYKKNSSVPTGNSEFNFKAGGLNFHSSGYYWLIVVSEEYAIFKGYGTINGDGTYDFYIWINENSGVEDTLRIKISDEEGEVVFDNISETTLGGGNIVIHK